MDQYKSARAEAEHVAGLLRAALTRAGVPEAEAARVRPLVTSTGRAYVELGAFRVGTASKLLDDLPLSTAGRHDTPAPSAEATG
ncbi:hypothetical protein [Streptomyces sediminimaris]|uniref:hypothetical protein n=1 Tax=Streptomyces sediminimaris TaxID=3383721 RepID=UPI00399B6F5D